MKKRNNNYLSDNYKTLILKYIISFFKNKFLSLKYYNFFILYNF